MLLLVLSNDWVTFSGILALLFTKTDWLLIFCRRSLLLLLFILIVSALSWQWCLSFWIFLLALEQSWPWHYWLEWINGSEEMFLEWNRPFDCIFTLLLLLLLPVVIDVAVYCCYFIHYSLLIPPRRRWSDDRWDMNIRPCVLYDHSCGLLVLVRAMWYNSDHGTILYCGCIDKKINGKFNHH